SSAGSSVDRSSASPDASPDAGASDADLIRGELGDLLFQVNFLACVAEESGAYDLGHVAAGIREKLVRRHPHIFGEAEANTPDDVRRTWDDIKRNTEGRIGIFHEVPQALSAALFAQKLQQRAATVGFDWREAADVFDKIREELDELEEAVRAHRGTADGRAGVPADAAASGRGPAAALGGFDASAGHERELRDRVEAEVGDLLFASVNLARKLKVDPELALRGAAHRFRARVEAAAGLAGVQGSRFEDMDLEEQETYYQRAKKGIKDGRGAPADGTQGSVGP
ncbi:MAG TPA: MazG nucleotide pyrophosphohydrolase domain-containing protein, partial [Thermoleophilia bacterium]|nr:MazG nucleotide pyrophosphohydrolase domain-containing protein [Thermoleophilia bacterium]